MTPVNKIPMPKLGHRTGIYMTQDQVLDLWSCQLPQVRRTLLPMLGHTELYISHPEGWGH